ncbi:MAG: DUF4349 domain-containing protein [Flavobacterium sp.]|uniref:DUF4349 domain-containing protein n=1 Tax=Flavobacterium sp. TaxID=239 RepID=UPI00122A9210|nr:DUF4349 domain-containing protein [Flavobacterium sp.]RZJ67966.1 MAG: DUF4349 domain-containing protein [Flavobacterium sp.]
MKKVLLAVFVAAVFSSCKEYASDEMLEDKTVYAAETQTVSLPDSIASPALDTETKIIRSANLKFETNDLSKTFAEISTSVKKVNGSVQNDSESKEYGTNQRILQVRIPSKNFDTFLSEISSGVSYFDQKEISSTDVTEEYIDTDSRIKTKKALEARYLELLRKANKVSEMLEVEAKLSEIREEIESKQARLNYLQNQVAMSSFTITFYKNVPENESAKVSFGSKIGNALASGINGLLDFFIWLLEMWPFILILVALIVFFRKRWRRRKKK